MAEFMINARGMQCPGPIVELFKKSKEAQAGDVIKIEVTDHGFMRDVQAWIKKTGNELEQLCEENGVIYATIVKK